MLEINLWPKLPGSLWSCSIKIMAHFGKINKILEFYRCSHDTYMPSKMIRNKFEKEYTFRYNDSPNGSKNLLLFHGMQKGITLPLLPDIHPLHAVREDK